MRQLVMVDEIRELELWPSKLFDEYLNLTKKEIKKFFNKDKLEYVPCPACNSKDFIPVFKKFELQYVECKKCKTVYLSPRPKNESIDNYYKKSKSIDFWYTQLIKKTIKKRTAHQAEPRAMWIANLTEEYFDNPETFISINTINQNLLEEISNLNLFKNKYLLDPYIKTSDSIIKKEKFYILEKNQKVYAASASAFGAIDRAFSPNELLKKARSSLIDKGIFFITGSTISGFDLQVLWENSKSIFPPDRMNILSIEGFSILFKRNGFEIIELSTPGQLDVDLVKNAIKNNPNLKIPRFVSYILQNRDENSHRSFQEFLQRHKLSSHIRIAAIKK